MGKRLPVWLRVEGNAVDATGPRSLSPRFLGLAQKLHMQDPQTHSLNPNQLSKAADDSSGCS